MKAVLLLSFFLISCSRQPPPTPAIDPRVSRMQSPSDATAIAGFRPSALGGIAAPFGDARYVLVSVRGDQVSTVVQAADGSVSGTKVTSSVSALLEDGEKLAARYPAWAVIRGGARLPLQGNLANLNNLLVDANLITVGVNGGDTFPVELTAQCPTEDQARRFEGSLRAVLLLLQAGPSAKVRRDGGTVQASMTVPAELMRKLVK